MDGACEMWKTRCLDHKKWHWFFLSFSMSPNDIVRHVKWDVRHVRWDVRQVKWDVTHVKWEYITPTLYVSMKTCTHFWCNSHEVHVARWIVFSLILQENDWNQAKTGHECDNNADGPFKYPSLISGDWWKRRRDRMKKKIFRRLIEKEIDCETLVSSRNVGASEVQNTSYLSQKKFTIFLKLFSFF